MESGGEHEFGEGAEVGWCGADLRSLLTAVQDTDLQFCSGGLRLLVVPGIEGQRG